jgi:hypothetical protein
MPVFNDKHLAWNWADAKWIYDTAVEMQIPFMAGSSMPVTPRVPPLHIPLGTEIEEIVVVAHGGLESYGFHALEMAQCLAERRQGGETGVAAIQCLTGGAFWNALRTGTLWARELEAAALAVGAHAPGTPLDHYAPRFASPAQEPAPPSEPGTPQRETNEPAIYLLEYRDGLRVTILMLNGYVTQRAAALRVRGEAAPLATWFTQARRQPVWHFCHQVDYIERMVESGVAPYPVERTLLTTGMVDAVMTSRYEGGRRQETPHLDVTYRPPEEPAHHERSLVVPGRQANDPL